MRKIIANHYAERIGHLNDHRVLCGSDKLPTIILFTDNARDDETVFCDICKDLYQ